MGPKIKIPGSHNRLFKKIHFSILIFIFITVSSNFMVASQNSTKEYVNPQLRSHLTPNSRVPKQFGLFEWLFGPTVPSNSNNATLSNENASSVSSSNHMPIYHQVFRKKDSPPSRHHNETETTLIHLNNSRSEISFPNTTNFSSKETLVYGPMGTMILDPKPRSSDRSNNSRQIQITDIQHSEGTEIDEKQLSSDPEQVNLQEELDVIDRLEKNLTNHPFSSGREKRQSSNKFRQLNIPYGGGLTNNRINTLSKRQLFLSPVDQQMLALRQQQDLTAAAAATMLQQQQLLNYNRYNNRYGDDYYDDDSSYEDSDEPFEDFNRLGIHNPLAEAMRRGILIPPVHHPMGLGRRSVPEDNGERALLSRNNKKSVPQELDDKFPLGPISKEGRWEMIEDYDLTSADSKKLQTRKGTPFISNRVLDPHTNLDESNQDDDIEQLIHGRGRDGLERQETTPDPSITTTPSTSESPTTPSTSESPTTPSTSESPTTPSTSESPTTASGSSTTAPTSGSPTTPSTSESPTTPSTSGSPTTAPASPTTAPTSGSPTTSSESPTTAPASPTTAPTSESPTTPSTSGSPTTPSTSGSPTTPSSSESPTTPSTSESPTTPSTSGSPTTPSTSGSPTSPSTSGNPTAPSTSGSPTSPSTSGNPTAPSTSGGPTSPSTSGNPTAPSTSGSPTTPSTSGSPTAPSTSGSPTTPSTSGSPTSPSTSGSPTTTSTGGSPTAPSTTVNPTTASTTLNPMSSTTTKSPKVPPFHQTMNCRCGVQSVRGENIGDGTIIRAMVNPWLVSIGTKQKHLCSGSIINNKYILTSRKCVKGVKATMIVTAGMGSRSAKNFTVIKVNPHKSRDIALLKIKPTIIPNQSIRPVCLPIKKIKNARDALSTGILVTFKKSNPKSSNSPLQLVQTEVPILSESKCANEDGEMPVGSICPGPPASMKCGGDSGGLLQVYQRGYSYEQIGVVSSTVGCRANKSPGIYTDLRKSVKWILYNTNDARYCRKPKITPEDLMNAQRSEAESDTQDLSESDELASDEESNAEEDDEWGRNLNI